MGYVEDRVGMIGQSGDGVAWTIFSPLLFLCRCLGWSFPSVFFVRVYDSLGSRLFLYNIIMPPNRVFFIFINDS